MAKSRLLRLWLVLGSVFMVVLIIVYWDNVGAAHFYLHPARPRPPAPEPRPSGGPAPPRLLPARPLETLLLGGRQPGLAGRPAGQPWPRASRKPGPPGNLEESVRGYDWSSSAAPQSADPDGRQAERRSVLRELCANASFVFPTSLFILQARHGLFMYPSVYLGVFQFAVIIKISDHE